jgi:hypothetical protein
MARVQNGRGVKVPPGSRKRLLIVEGAAVDAAMSEAVRHALLTHKRAGNPVASWEGGKVVIIPAEEIEVEETPADSDVSPEE